MKFCFKVVALVAALSASQAATAAYVESVSGDLSNDATAPTGLTVSAGSNVVTGSTITSPFDRDIFSFTLAANQQLDSIVLNSYTGPAGGNGSFFAVQSGSGINTGNAGAHLGNELIGQAVGIQQGDDVLDDMGTPRFGSSPGFTGALGPGTYTFWIQETAGPLAYSLDFQVSEVPLPAAAWLFGSALLGLGALKRRRAPSLSRSCATT